MEVNSTETVYEFLYNSDCCESSAHTMSIHKTKKGAEMAMEFHKNEIKKEWDDEEFEWNFNQWWGIRETVVMP